MNINNIDMNTKRLIIEATGCRGTKTAPNIATDPTHLATHDCYQCPDDNNKWYCEPKASTTTTTTTSGGGTTTTTTTSGGGTTTTTTTSGGGGMHIPDMSDLITNAWGKITSWFGVKVDNTGDWMKDKFTKSDIERAQEECYKVPFKDEDSAKKALESGDIVDYYQLKDKDGKVVFLGKAWDCDNKGGTPPCFKNLAGGKYDSEKEAYIEEYFEELNDAGVYEYYCNGSVAFKPYYESDETGGYVESGRPKVWYKWNPKNGVIDKA
jgi:hypothetical protein